MNTGTRQFANVSGLSGLNHIDDARTIGVTDWDQDGDLDMWMSNRNAPMLRFMRNNHNAKNGYLALRLQGVKVNRDAIGARVNVQLGDGEHSDKPLIKTLRAGEGFLSQSSKWLHFGLGNATSIRRVTVQWPGGQPEVFEGIKPNQHYRLVEGSGKATQFQSRTTPVNLVEAATKLPPVPGESRLLLVAPVPLPVLVYDDLDGKRHSLQSPGNKSLLISLWASWCKPCMTELRALVQERKRLSDAGIDVLALNVDALTDDSTSPKALNALLKELGYPFSAGLADKETVSKLETLVFGLSNLEAALPLPTSVLVDKNRYVGAVYRGIVPIDQLIEDAALFNHGMGERREAAAQAPGRWFSPLPQPIFSPIAKLYWSLDYPYTALRFAKAEIEANPKDDESRQMYGLYLAQLGKTKQAEEQLKMAVTLAPKNASHHQNYAISQGVIGNHNKAIEHLKIAIGLDSKNPILHLLIGKALHAQGQTNDAEKHLDQALKLNPRLKSARAMLDSMRKNPTAN